MFDHLRSSSDARPPADAAPDCAADPVEALRRMFVDMVMGRRLGGGQKPALRPVFLKPHGVARGRFTIRPNLPEELRVGVFAGSSERRPPARRRHRLRPQPGHHLRLRTPLARRAVLGPPPHAGAGARRAGRYSVTFFLPFFFVFGVSSASSSAPSLRCGPLV